MLNNFINKQIKINMRHNSFSNWQEFKTQPGGHIIGRGQLGYPWEASIIKALKWAFDLAL